MKEEKIIVPANGYLMLFVFLTLFFGSIIALIAMKNPWFIILVNSLSNSNKTGLP